ncbi:PUTATIVE TWO-COMPONENT SENSOR [hydrothermal vent metagenome]|uniref:PUTATIVE TWO-COMPONENT SENSOR n=1 Tax=hydrothermal vent metagenome TaxID=652676 RepID=A0A3B1E5L1_9ZZZZ
MIVKSIYKHFYQKLILATSIFVIILSFIFYGFIKSTIYNDIFHELLENAVLVDKLSKNYVFNNKEMQYKLFISDNIKIDLIPVANISKITYKQYVKGKDNFVELLYPFDKEKQLFLKLTKNTNSANKLLNKIFSNILFLCFGGFKNFISSYY